MTKQNTDHKDEQKQSQGLSSQFIKKMAAELQALKTDQRQLR